MARLRVGDIQIDGADVTVRPAPHSTPAVTGGAPAAAQWLAKVSRRMLAYSGLAAIAVGSSLLVLLWPGPDPLGFVLRGGIVVLGGLGLVALAALQPLLKGAVQAEQRARYAEARERIRPLVAQRAAHQTVEWLSAHARLTEPEVVGALLTLRADGELVEELDLETGQFYYALASSAAAQSSENLDARAQRIVRGGTR
mgnify:CR=1 FL=1